MPVRHDRAMDLLLEEKTIKLIQNALHDMRQPVRLVAFSTIVGCIQCPRVIELAHHIRSHSANKIVFELYDMTMDRDKAVLYGIRHVPALVVQDGTGRAVTLYGLMNDVFLNVLLETILAVSTQKVWFTDQIRSTLKLLERDVDIQVFVENNCSRCKPVADTAIGLALESDLIHTNIIIASDFPDLVKKYHISALPKTIFGENLHLDGHVNESAFLEKIFEAEGVQWAHEKRCIVCVNASPDIICASCKARIQAEAFFHKLREERARHSDPAARRHEK